MIKISEKSYTQRFDDSMSSFLSGENKIDNLIYTTRVAKILRYKSVHLSGVKFK